MMLGLPTPRPRLPGSGLCSRESRRFGAEEDPGRAILARCGGCFIFECVRMYTCGYFEAGAAEAHAQEPNTRYQLTAGARPQHPRPHQTPYPRFLKQTDTGIPRAWRP
jgi:hypothetical protein